MIVLASSSPQRKLLLEQIGISPFVIPSDIPESLGGAVIVDAIRELAFQKAKAIIPKVPPNATPPLWIIGADTVILHSEIVMGKPENRAHAKQMINILSGTTHSVLTGVCVCLCDATKDSSLKIISSTTKVSDTKVTFRELENEDICWYLSTGEWDGAAGSYRIQGKGACLVSGLNGSYSNVVGLPLELIYGMLSQLGFSFENG